MVISPSDHNLSASLLDFPEGLKSNTGKHKSLSTVLHLKKPKNKIEELELELMKKDIEIARLKKGYMVKGVGAEKEYVTTLDKNMK